MKQSLKAIEEEKKRIFDQKKLKQELTLIVTNLEDFSSNITSNLDNADWLIKRDIIRTLVKRIDIEDVNVVFRIKELPNSSGHNGEEKQNLQHCWRSTGIFVSALAMHLNRQWRQLKEKYQR
ncbi:hypothetical protein [Wolbachia endosymbiont of Oedothorax gibbosus]|uniref:hypothetical protein n=1 Tax=Wolbachia endosymbiont of Oedothorax gibbosus TaxID=931100 RepID=UPI00202528DA|nr:hypothetical protein [Wolbachia endosymbiont of Oedothorax gibbosus]